MSKRLLEMFSIGFQKTNRDGKNFSFRKNLTSKQLRKEPKKKSEDVQSDNKVPSKNFPKVPKQNKTKKNKNLFRNTNVKRVKT